MSWAVLQQISSSSEIFKPADEPKTVLLLSCFHNITRIKPTSALNNTSSFYIYLKCSSKNVSSKNLLNLGKNIKCKCVLVMNKCMIDEWILPHVFQMFQRLCIHVIQRLRPVHAHLYLQPGMEDGYVTPDYWQLWKFNVSPSRLFFLLKISKHTSCSIAVLSFCATELNLGSE